MLVTPTGRVAGQTPLRQQLPAGKSQQRTRLLYRGWYRAGDLWKCGDCRLYPLLLFGRLRSDHMAKLVRV